MKTYTGYRLTLGGDPCYAGQTYDPRRREREHRQAYKSGKCPNYCGPELYAGLRVANVWGLPLKFVPIVTGLTLAESLAWEKAEIIRLGEDNLFNETEAERRERLARLNANPEVRAKNLAHLARIASDPEVNARRSATMKATAVARRARSMVQ